MLTPGYVLYSKRMEFSLSRRDVSEGICARSTIGAYELSYSTPSDAMAALLCERLRIEPAYFQMVLAAHRKMLERMKGSRKRGDFRGLAFAYKELLERERHPVVQERYKYCVKLCWKVAVEGRG